LFAFTICSDMPAAAPAPDQDDDAADADGWERALLDHQLAELGRLAAMGMDIASAVHRRATADKPGPDADLQHAAVDFARVARAVRMTFALQSRLIADFKGRSRPAGAADEPYDGPLEVRWLDPEPEPAEGRKHRVRQSVRRAAEDAGCDHETVERLVLEAGERLEDDDIHAALATRPFDEIVALIRQDLGLEPPVAARGGEPCGGQGFGRHANARGSLRAGAADPGAKPGEERGVEGASGLRHASASLVRDSS
jgi:hypothetical protein